VVARLIADDTENTRQSFGTLHCRSDPLLRGEKGRHVNGLFKFRPRDMPRDHRQIVSTSRRAPYVSSSLLKHSAPMGDAALIRHCVEKNLLHIALDSWTACLAPNAAMLISCADLYDGKWFMSCQASGGSCNLRVPVTSVLVGARQFYCFDSVVEPTAWQCVLEVGQSH